MQDQRDFFAAFAMNALIKLEWNTSDLSVPAMAKEAFQIADEMVKASQTKTESFNPALEMKIDSLRLSTRTTNALLSHDLLTIGDIAKCSQEELLRFRNFGF